MNARQEILLKFGGHETNQAASRSLPFLVLAHAYGCTSEVTPEHKLPSVNNLSLNPTLMYP